MLKELWKFITNLGIGGELSTFDEKAIKLINQLSFIMMIWFSFFSLTAIFNYQPMGLLLTASNIALFGIVLFLNYFGYTTISKNYFMIFGIGMVTFVNIVFGKENFPMVQFITTSIFPILIFKKRKTAFIYFMLNILFFIFIIYYHKNYEPFWAPSARSFATEGYIGVLIIMTVVYLIALFFRNVGDDLEFKLVEKNRYLNDLIERTNSMQEQLINSEKMASLGQLTAGIAHEINNPINFVSSNISPLKTDLNELKELCKKYKSLHDAKNIEEILKEIDDYRNDIDPDFLYKEIETLTNGIEEGAERTKQIVLGLRSFSRIDEDEFKMLDIHEGIDSTLMLLRNKIKNRIEVHKNYGKLPQVECMPGKLNQVFMNIINNASEAIPDKGEIFITTSVNTKGNFVKISIKDSGIGMTEVVKRRIFEPFFTTKEIGKGTGLGMSISFGIIEQHNGDITIESKENKGSEFIITLPVKQSKNP